MPYKDLERRRKRRRERYRERVESEPGYIQKRSPKKARLVAERAAIRGATRGDRLAASAERRRKRRRERYRERVESEPGYREGRNAYQRKRRRERWANDPTYREARLEEARRRRSESPEAGREYSGRYAREHRAARAASAAKRYRRMGGHSPHRYWPKLYIEQRGRCGLCGEPMLDLTAIHVHHIWALKFWGPTVLWNLMATHRDCNERAGADWDAATLWLGFMPSREQFWRGMQPC